MQKCLRKSQSFEGMVNWDSVTYHFILIYASVIFSFETQCLEELMGYSSM